jgi:hypothetical protein
MPCPWIIMGYPSSNEGFASTLFLKALGPVPAGMETLLIPVHKAFMSHVEIENLQGLLGGIGKTNREFFAILRVHFTTGSGQKAVGYEAKPRHGDAGKGNYEKHPHQIKLLGLIRHRLAG